MCDEWLTTPSSKTWNHEESSEDNGSQLGGQEHKKGQHSDKDLMQYK